MEGENPRRTLGDYSKPINEGYRNTIEIPNGKMRCLLDPTPPRWCKTDAYSTDFGKERVCVYFNFPFEIKLAIGLNVSPQSQSPLGKKSYYS
ncbi:hypothetical protein Tco_0108903 [Tanacetum coccineum]